MDNKSKWTPNINKRIDPRGAQENSRDENGCWAKCQNKKNLSIDDYEKATQFWLFSCKRPHMRGFQASWFGTFIAFFGWFSVQSLVPDIQEDLKLTDEEVANSGIAAVVSVIGVRLATGPLTDRFGPRRIMAILLMTGGISLGVTGLTSTANGLIITRFFIGILGATIVPCHSWAFSLFSSNIVGAVNSLAAGWGTMGVGVAFLVMPLLLKLVLLIGVGKSNAWKICLTIPATICLISAVLFWLFTDDCPQGRWGSRKTIVEIDTLETANGTVNAASDDSIVPAKVADDTSKKFTKQNNKGFRGHIGFRIFAIAVLFIQFSGVGISINSTMNVYLLRKFKDKDCDLKDSKFANTTMMSDECSIISAETASLITSIFNLMLLFACLTGGLFSDLLAKRFSLSGRLMIHSLFLAMHGSLMILFGYMESLPSAIAVLILWSFCYQNTQGTNFGLEPFIWPKRVGLVSGILAMGATSGSICWNLLWRYSLDNMSRYYTIVGSVALCSSLLTIFVFVGGYNMLDPCLKKGIFREGNVVKQHNNIHENR
ncbi:unnamed protein product [Owenia fusiformis]|uniref:Uncharacterized protein n=1 Tax=Owenia fusiformis TaxID=6347 RepID=A0A8J1U5E7_OWEFU|nr:unnamed protein product [Owenia fusiformis]